MSQAHPTVGQHVYLPKAGLSDLVRILREDGYSVIAPTAVDGAVSLRPVESAEQLPLGLRDEQEAGYYRLKQGDPELYFQHTLGPDSPKRFLYPPVHRLFRLHMQRDAFAIEAGPAPPPKLAFLGVRPCELSAMAIHDRVFCAADGGVAQGQGDADFCQARQSALVIAVNCTHPGGTCFCVSMGTGPKAEDYFDLALTELRGGFVVEVGSPRGAALAERLPLRQASSAELELAELRLHQARQQMGRTMHTDDLPQILAESLEHPYWDQIAQRCLGCTSCTMVCPTCFCTSIEDDSALDGSSMSRTRKWDSCYTHQFSYTTSGPVRSSIRARHRQWVFHKLSSWWNQFGCSGCVGCGRCITWCPVGIDITQDAAAIRGERQADRPVGPRFESEVAP